MCLKALHSSKLNTVAKHMFIADWNTEAVLDAIRVLDAPFEKGTHTHASCYTPCGAGRPTNYTMIRD
jgi:hypothetical protein